ncbi:MAG: HEPN domain-containing protein [Candidatus Aenigmarchaeota archaeon]|nr:HEPN domain-containing protein [Candidatus Aenigmarchaeota archaeon]
MVKEVKKEEAADYLKQAGEFLESAADNLNKNRLNAAGFDATQSIINANDALTIFFLGKRASKDHREAIQFHTDVVRIINDSAGRKIIRDALEMRNTAGYLGTSVSKAVAENLVKEAMKFIEWVKGRTKLGENTNNKSFK